MNGDPRKARQQVESHVAAGHPNSGAGTDNGGGHFVSTETVSRVGFGDRTVPDVHLTRFAAYFVALNADQSKPESTAHDTPMRGCMIQRLGAVDCNDIPGFACEHPGKKSVCAGRSVSGCHGFWGIVRGLFVQRLAPVTPRHCR